MLSGIYPTSTFNTLKSLIMLLYHIIKMACQYGESIQEALRCIKFVGYGDDTVMSFPMRYLKYFTDEPQLFYPEKLAATYKEFGCILKPGETEIYIPAGGLLPHKDRLYTYIVDDEIVSKGAHILQRYFVKYDNDYNPLHPDDPNFAFVKPWRKTSTFMTKVGTDAQGFKGKHGRAQTCKNIWINFYCKTFGLLLDAGPNLKAHRLLKQILSDAATDKPWLPLICQTQWRETGLFDIVSKLGVPYSLVDQLIARLPKEKNSVSYVLLNRPESYHPTAYMRKFSPSYPATVATYLMSKSSYKQPVYRNGQYYMENITNQ
jgi:hypothetical protein